MMGELCCQKSSREYLNHLCYIQSCVGLEKRTNYCWSDLVYAILCQHLAVGCPFGSTIPQD
jgi:hypothetical protein